MENMPLSQQMPQPNLPQNNTPQNYNERKKNPTKLILIILGIAVLLLLVLAGVYAYIMKIGPFSNPLYTEKNLLSGVLNASSKIDSSSYSLSASFNIGQRDADAKPFVTKLSNAEEIEKKYKNDLARTTHTRDVLWMLSSYSYKDKKYPDSLSTLTKSVDYRSGYGDSTKDPLTKKTYGYTQTDEGKNFNLVVNFETSDAISAIKRSYEFSPTSTIINGETVTFTKDSKRNFYLSPEPPKPFLVTLADNLTYVPKEIEVSASVSAQTDFSSKDAEEWKFNVDATGDLGDLSYKINIDALRKDGIYYFKINNIPSIFSGFLGVDKGQWTKIDPNKTSSNGSYLVKGLPEAEKNLKENREELTDLLNKIIELANNNNLISFKNSPRQEKINSRQFYRYDIELRKEAVLPFYQQLQKEIDKKNLKNNYPIFEDSGLVEYLQSQEFSEVFDYYQENTSLSLWVDEQGYPAIVSYNMRIIPQDSATQLKDRQGNLIFKLELSDINKPVDIKAPANAKDIQSNPYYQIGIEASIKSYMSALIVSGEVLYDSNKSYSKLCSDKSYLDIKKNIDDTYGTGSKVTCLAQSQKWCASALLASGSYYCVDSKGIKKESSNSDVCLNGVCGS